MAKVTVMDKRNCRSRSLGLIDGSFTTSSAMKMAANDRQQHGKLYPHRHVGEHHHERIENHYRRQRSPRCAAKGVAPTPSPKVLPLPQGLEQQPGANRKRQVREEGRPPWSKEHPDSTCALNGAMLPSSTAVSCTTASICGETRAAREGPRGQNSLPDHWLETSEAPGEDDGEATTAWNSMTLSLRLVRSSSSPSCLKEYSSALA